DRFCLDGQRLVEIPGQTYGADGTEYRTEIETFTMIISHGGNPNDGPDWFEIRTKDGRILEYGNSTSSRFTVSGIPYTWALNKVSDRVGNAMSVAYQSDSPVVANLFGTTLQPLPLIISYTEFGGLANGDRAVFFEYLNDRDDRMTGSAPGGIPIRRTKLLNR